MHEAVVLVWLKAGNVEINKSLSSQRLWFASRYRAPRGS